MSLEHSQSLVDFLANELKNRSARNPRYSLRAFAQALKLSPGELSEILRGRRKPTLKGAIKIARALQLSSDETQKLLALTDDFQSAGGDPSTQLQSRQLTMDLFHVVSDWYCFAILSLADTQDFNSDPKKIARRLGITEMECKIAVERLERVGLIERIEPARQDRKSSAKPGYFHFRATPDYVLSPQGIPSEAVRNYHRQILEKAARALDEQSVDEREIAGTTFAIDPKDLPKIKKELHRLLDRLAAESAKPGSARRTEVYHLEAALFRLSKPSFQGDKT